MSVLKDGLAKHPADRDILLALISFNRGVGDIDSALAYAERLASIAPNDRGLAGLIQELRRQVKKPDAQ